MCELRNRRGRGGREGLLVYNDCYFRRTSVCDTLGEEKDPSKVMRLQRARL
jgi:hypothetical protein